ncbi:MAG: AsnC family transcriptional regulator [Chromatiales bacterium]
MSPLAVEFINRFQGGFPLSGRPFSRVAAKLGTTETALTQTIGELLDAGFLSRFGPLYDAARLGGGLTLAAMAVPEADFEIVTQQVNALPGVAHNYRRDHRLNMWFVVATDTPDGVAKVLARIEQLTGLPVYNFPKQREFYLGLWLQLNADGSIDTVPVPRSRLSPAHPLDETDRRLVAATQAGLPLVAQPYDAIAEQLDLSVDEVLQRLQAMLDCGVIRRIGAVPNHYKLGLRGNGMTVWNVPDDKLEELGARIGALDFVSHCYQRPRHADVWPYNLFAMVHGRDRIEVLAKTEQLQALLGEHYRAHEVLFSSAVLKKTGLRVAA